MYLVNGPQKSYEANFRRMSAYPGDRGIPMNTSLVTQHYDPRFDSVFMVKLYLLTY
jgi:hypothetical protein